MSERGGSGIGPFLLGVTVGAVLGVLFAPEAGAATRGKVGKGVRRVRDNAEEMVDDLRSLVMSGDETEGEEESERTPRQTLEHRLLEARQQRRSGGGGGGGVASGSAEEHEPLA